MLNMCKNAVSALHGGLSDMGRRVVREMNRIGLYVPYASRCDFASSLTLYYRVGT